ETGGDARKIGGMILTVGKGMGDMVLRREHVRSVGFQQQSIRGHRFVSVEYLRFLRMEKIPGKGEIGAEIREAPYEFRGSAKRMEQESSLRRRFGCQCVDQRLPGFQRVDGQWQVPFPGYGDLGQKHFPLDCEDRLIHPSVQSAFSERGEGEAVKPPLQMAKPS